MFNDSLINSLNSEEALSGYFSAPEERLGHAACPEMTLSDNVLITCSKTANLTKFGFIQKDLTRNLTQKIISKFDVRTKDFSSLASSFLAEICKNL